LKLQVTKTMQTLLSFNLSSNPKTEPWPHALWGVSMKSTYILK